MSDDTHPHRHINRLHVQPKPLQASSGANKNRLISIIYANIQNPLCNCADSRSRLCGFCRPASGHTVRGMSEREPAVNQRPHQVQYQASVKEVWVLMLVFCMFQLFPTSFSLVLDARMARCRLGVLGGKVGKIIIINPTISNTL